MMIGSIDPSDDSWKASDTAFQVFLDTVTPADFSEWEWRLFQGWRLRLTERKPA